MSKSIKCILIDVDNVLITEIEEVAADVGEPDCRLINPYRFYNIKEMKPWIEISDQTEYMIRSSDILTIADPTEEVIEKYLELTKE
ncbi:MAG: hypothetical protein EBS34_10785 [Flavobacteriales bacterium]|nr:hypothetical protein [Flavobacteriales bacterium]